MGPSRDGPGKRPTCCAIGRLDPLEIVLDDSSVSRYHAEVRATDRGWRVRDLGSTNGTRLNGVRLGARPVAVAAARPAAVRRGRLRRRGHLEDQPDHGRHRPTDESGMRVEATAKSSWDQALEGLAFDSKRSSAGRRAAAGPAAGRPSPRATSRRKKTFCIRSSTTPSPCSTPSAAPSCWPRGRTTSSSSRRSSPAAMSRAPWRAGRSDVGGRFQFSQSLANALRQPRRIDPVSQRRGRRRTGVGQEHRRGGDGLRAVRPAAHAAQTPGRAAPRPQPVAKAVHHGRPAPGRRPGRQRLGRHRMRQLLRKQRDLFLDTITVLAQAVELQRTNTPAATPTASPPIRCCWRSTGTCRRPTWS